MLQICFSVSRSKEHPHTVRFFLALQKPMPQQIADERAFRLYDEYTPVKDLYEGAGGVCSLVQSKTTGKLVVIKRLTKAAPVLKPREVTILTQILPSRHPNIIEVFDAVRPRDGVWQMYLEYCSGGDLVDQIRHLDSVGTARGEIPEVLVLHVFVSMVQALAFLHHGVRTRRSRLGGMSFTKDPDHTAMVHGDIKPDNILLRWSNNPQFEGMPDIVLADFGFARLANASYGPAGTEGYEAPEVQAAFALKANDPAGYARKRREKDVVTTAADVYSFGVSMVKLLSRCTQFAPGDDPETLKLPRFLKTGKILRAVKECLQLERRDRLTMDSGKGNAVEKYLGEFIRRREYITRIAPMKADMWYQSR